MVALFQSTISTMLCVPLAYHYGASKESYELIALHDQTRKFRFSWVVVVPLQARRLCRHLLVLYEVLVE